MNRWLPLLAGFVGALNLCAATLVNPLTAGITAYEAGDYRKAAQSFRDASQTQPAAGTLVNLGLAEWQQGRVGQAIVAWEQARWLDPFEPRAQNNLRFARNRAQLEPPELAWHEIASTWLPGDWWAWIVGGSLWFVVAMLTLPGVLRWRKSPWHQALAALGLGVLLLSLPAHVGVLTRMRLGFVLEQDVPLRLTPTSDAENVTRLGAGEPARLLRKRGEFVLLRANHATGWLKSEEFGLICAP